ncbi:MAG: hypothetical protein IKS37_07275 [Solobacterium sp.]|nr:hypothetical protein [Solobacterium sp.]
MISVFIWRVGHDLPREEIEKNGRPVEVAAKAPNILEEYFKDHECLKLDGETRLIIYK